MGDVKVPKIEFPCDYPIKVIGEAVPDFLEQVVAIVRTYDDTLTADRLTERDSRKGNYRSITMQVHVVSEAQLQPMFLELKAVAAVRMVL
ncbi:MAG: hypothetical protein CMQ29_03730 [Gammaproteobacteria bacterium]|nr:hypothetical protein [Gammaproteobacteria bacterium]